MPRICIVPAVEGIGGMATFRRKFEAGLTRRGIEFTHDPGSRIDALLVIAGTRHLLPLFRARRRGVRIVQRLDGINWIHRRRRTGVRHFRSGGVRQPDPVVHPLPPRHAHTVPE